MELPDQILPAKAVVLAAGRGTRMGDLTVETPKPLLKLNGKPLLHHVLSRLEAAGVKRALVITGYRAEVIESALPESMVALEFRRQEVLNGTAGAALLARGFAGNEDFLLTYGDILADPADYRRLAGLLAGDPSATAVVGVNRVDDPWQGAAVYHQAHRVNRIIEKPPRGTSSTCWNNSGIYAFRSRVFEYFAGVQPSARGEYELTAALGTMLASGERILACELLGIWLDVGRPEDLVEAERLLAGGISLPPGAGGP